MTTSAAMLAVTLMAAAATEPPPAEVMTTQATATLVAAVIAGIAAVFAAVVGLINAARNLRQVRREQWWQQFQWGIEKALSHDRDASDVGVAVMNKLVQQKEARAADNEIALIVADLVTERTNRPYWWRRKQP